MVLLVPLAKKEVPLALRVRQVGLQPPLVALGQRAAGYAVVGGEAAGHVT